MIDVSLIVPTRDPARFFSRIGALPLPFKQVVLYIQPPWTRKDTARARSSFPTVTVINGPALPPNQISFIDWELKMLNQSHCDLIMMADDDLLFRAKGSPRYPQGSAERIADAVRYLHAHPLCMAIMQLGYLGGSQAKENIVPSQNGLIAIDRGLIFRRESRIFYSIRGIGKQIGALAESLLIFPLLERKGTYYARQYNVPTQRLLEGHRKWSYVAGTEFICQRYADPTWTHEARRFPKGLQK